MNLGRLCVLPLFSLLSAYAESSFAVPASPYQPRQPDQAAAAAKSFEKLGFTVACEQYCGWSILIFRAQAHVSDDDLQKIVCPPFSFVLDLSGSRVSDAGMKHLARIENLYRLNLRRTRVTGAGLKELAGLPPLSVDVDETQVTGRAIRGLKGLRNLPWTLHLATMSDESLHCLRENGLLYLLANAGGKRSEHAASTADVMSFSLHEGANWQYPKQAVHVTDAGLKEIASLTNVAILDLAGGDVTDAGLKDLAGLQALTALDLSATKITDVGLRQIANFRNLSDLKLNNTAVTDAGLQELSRLTNLSALNLYGAKVTAAGLTHLAKFNHLSLYLDDRVIADAAAKDLAGLGRLSWTLFVGNSDAVLRTLRANGLLHWLGGATNDKGLRPASVHEIVKLALRGRQVSNAGLAELGDLTNLAELDLRFTAVNGTGLKNLAGFTNLSRLDLGYTSVTDASLTDLAGLKTLATLNLHHTKVTSLGVAELQKALPRCVIAR